MGSNEMDKSPKEAKESKESRTPTSQEQPSATTAGTPDWAGFQAYSPIAPAGYLASSPQPHPYMWGLQQFMPPYGTPPHTYVAMYPPGGVYAPSIPPGSYPFSPFAMPSPNGIAEASANAPGNSEADGKPSEGKEKLPIKRSKGSLNMITGRNNEPGKTSGVSANGGYSKSGDSGSEGSSEGSDANSQNESEMKSGHRQDSGETSQNGSGAHGSQNGGSAMPHSMVNTMGLIPISAPGGVLGPTTNLNIGMDYWGAVAASPTVPAICGKVPSTPVAGGIPAGRDGVQSQLWLQDERELKRQRRKQSNRESARRSRLRKQADCDELAQRADALNKENASLRAEVARIRSECEQLLAQNASLKERLGEVPGQDDLRSSRNDQHRDDDDDLHSEKGEPLQRGEQSF